MLTIKVRSAPGLGGEEEIYEAESIRVIRTGDMYRDGIYLDPTVGEIEPPAAGDPPTAQEPPILAKHVILFGHDRTDAGIKRQGGKVWVMNGHGETVATYDL